MKRESRKISTVCFRTGAREVLARTETRSPPTKKRPGAHPGRRVPPITPPLSWTAFGGCALVGLPRIELRGVRRHLEAIAGAVRNRLIADEGLFSAAPLPLFRAARAPPGAAACVAPRLARSSPPETDAVASTPPMGAALARLISAPAAAWSGSWGGWPHPSRSP